MTVNTVPRLERLVFFLFLVIAAVITLFPFFWMVSTSFKVQVELASRKVTLLPQTWTLENYRQLFTYFSVVRHFANSLVFAGGTTVISLVLNSLAAFAFACLTFPGRERLFTLLMMTLLVPLQVTLVPLFLTLKYLGLLNTLAGLILPGSASVVGIFLLRQFMRDLPKEILEQAKIDGCTDFDLFWRIVLPLCKPIIATMSVFTFVGVWNEFLGPLVIMLRESGYPLPVALANLSSEHGGETGMLMAGAMLTVLPSVLVFILAQRHYLKGITAGAVR
jgi:multiple sugar transport system permease protein